MRFESTPSCRRSWPFVFAATICVVALATILFLSLKRTDGHVVYALDDPYIHMAMAKNLARHGVWGISTSHFTSSSSSLLWTSLLGMLFVVFGVHEIIPFLLNVILGLALLFVVSRELSRSGADKSPFYKFATLIAVAAAMPLPALVFVGQEHVLHTILTVLFVRIASELLHSSPSATNWSFLRLCGIAIFMAAIRYESLFAISIVALVLIAQCRWLNAVGLVALPSLPAALYGAISHWLGWYWLPNSVLLKGNRPDFSSFEHAARSFGYNAYSALMTLPAVAFLLYAALIAFGIRLARRANDTTQWKLAIFCLMTLAHCQFAQPQSFWFYRYEAYLVVLGIVVISEALHEWWTDIEWFNWSMFRAVGGGFACVALLLFSPLTDRALKGLARVPQATTNIYEQQYQMGLFLRQFYSGQAIALNDIGAATFLADIECIDLVGLANLEIARRRLNGWFLYDDIDELVRGNHVSIAIVYDSWFSGRIPPSWLKAGTWTIRDNVVAGDRTVSFYAMQPEGLIKLRENLRRFSRRLPLTVAQHFY